MKTLKQNRAFTLVELLVATSISIVVLGAILWSQIIGLRLWKVQSLKTKALTSAYISLNQIAYDIKGAYTVQLGTNTSTGFYPLSDGVEQEANALKIVRSSTTNDWFVYYYMDTSNAIYKGECPGTISNKLVIKGVDGSQPLFYRLCYTNGVKQTSMHNTNSDAVFMVDLRLVLSTNDISQLLTNMVNTNILNAQITACIRKL